MLSAMSPNETAASRPAAAPASLAWRLLAMTYDAFPLMLLALLVSGASLVLKRGDATASLGGGLAIIAATWLVCGAYFVVSWRRGGQTIGMRPWRLRVLAADGGAAGTGALWLRYAAATASLAAAGLGFLWSLVDRERRTWHDLASGTVLVRVDAPKKG
jgi:uncharacterized RDD family membrane protein YckC